MSKTNASEKPVAGKKKNQTNKQQTAKLRKSVKELTARLDAIEEHILNGTPIEKTVEQASINKAQDHLGEKHTPQDTQGGFDLDEHTKLLSCINACVILPSNDRDPILHMHTKENIRAIVGFPVSDELRLQVYDDVKFKLHLEQFGLSVPVAEEK